MSVLELLRQYTLREYTAVIAVALLGGAGVVFMLNAAGASPASSETIALKREVARSTPAASVRSVEAESRAAARRAKERARIVAERRRIHALRAARAARRAAAAARAPQPVVVRSAPRPAVTAPTRVSNPVPAPSPRPTPAPKPTPKQSGAGGGGGGSFDDSG